MIDQFLLLTRGFPEPQILVGVDGSILAANPAATRLLSVGPRPGNARLQSLVSDPPDRLAEYLAACARSGSPVPGSVSISNGSGAAVRYRCEGAGLRPDGLPGQPLLTLRFRLHAEASQRFLLLNQKIDQLTREIAERRRVEEELQVQAMQLEETAAELEITIDQLEEQKEAAVAAQTEAERGAEALAALVRRLEVLADAGEILSSSLDPDQTLARLADLCTATLADFCITYVLEDDGSVRRVGASHSDPSRRSVLERLLQLVPLSVSSETGVARVVRTGEVVYAPEVTDEMLRESAESDEHFSILRELRSTSNIIVPLEARGRIIGAIAVATVEGSRPAYTTLDVSFMQEIARRAALSVDNLRLLHAAQEANRAKSDFLAVMSHELRTPLNAIVGYVDLMETGIGGAVTDRQREQLRRIERNASHLITIIAEILEYARLEAGREVVEPEEVDLREVARDAAEALEAVAIPQGIEFGLDLPSDPIMAVTDPAKVRQILLNLLSNALKFTGEGEVGLTLTRDGDEAVCVVHDTGVGIAPQDFANVFEPFWQVHRGPTRKAGGTGLGLTVTRRLARLLGGDILLESDPGSGSRFFFRLPLRPDPDAPDPTDHPRRSHTEPGSTRTDAQR